MFPFFYFNINYYGSGCGFMIINKIENEYLIKIIDKNIDIYNREKLENMTKEILKKIIRTEKIKGLILMEIFTNKQYGIIIKLKNIKALFKVKDEIEVKIVVHIDTPFLYKMEYFDIEKNKKEIGNIYYYQKEFYTSLKENIKLDKYYQILELSSVIYEDTPRIITRGIKMIV